MTDLPTLTRAEAQEAQEAINYLLGFPPRRRRAPRRLAEDRAEAARGLREAARYLDPDVRSPDGSEETDVGRARQWIYWAVLKLTGRR